MQGQRNLQSLTDQIMNELTPVVDAQHGAFYLAETDGERPILALTSSYAFMNRKRIANRFTGTLTGKGRKFGGSVVRTDATGYGTAYFAQRMLESGANHLAVAELMGHSTGRMVSETYSHMNRATEHLKEALRKASGEEAEA